MKLVSRDRKLRVAASLVRRGPETALARGAPEATSATPPGLLRAPEGRVSQAACVKPKRSQWQEEMDHALGPWSKDGLAGRGAALPLRRRQALLPNRPENMTLDDDRLAQ